MAPNPEQFTTTSYSPSSSLKLLICREMILPPSSVNLKCWLNFRLSICNEKVFTCLMPKVDRYYTLLAKSCKMIRISNHRDKYAVLLVWPDDTWEVISPSNYSVGYSPKIRSFRIQNLSYRIPERCWQMNWKICRMTFELRQPKNRMQTFLSCPNTSRSHLSIS